MTSSAWKSVHTKHRAVAYLSKSLGEASKKSLSEASSVAKRLTRSHMGQISGESSSRHEESRSSVWFGVISGQRARAACVLDRGYRVPKLLAVLRRMISDHDMLASEGMFRISADARIQALVRERLEQGEDPEHVLDGCSPMLLSAILKEYLRSLPGGAWLTGEAAAELQAQLLQGSGGRPAMLLKQALQPDQLQVFLWSLDLLVDASTHSATSRMDDRALCVIFAPLLIPADDDAPPSEQLRMAQDRVELLRKMLADHRQTFSRGAKPTRPAVDSAAAVPTTLPALPGVHDKGPPALSRGGRRATKRASSSNLDPPAPVRRKSSVVDGSSTSTAHTGLTVYTQSSLVFDDDDKVEA